MSVDESLQAIFRDVFGDDDLEVSDELTAGEIAGWDSVTHLTLMFSIEQRLGVQFSDEELTEFANVGELRRSLERKLGR